MSKTPECDPSLGFCDPNAFKSKTYIKKNVIEYEWAITFDQDTDDVSVWFKKKKEDLFFRMKNSKRNEKQISNCSDFESVKAGTWPICKVIQRSSKPELIDQNDEMRLFSAKLDAVCSQTVPFVQMLRFEKRLENLENRHCDHGREC